MALTALHRLAFDLLGERSHQPLGRTIGGENRTVLIYCPIITGLSGRTGGNDRERDKRTGRERERQIDGREGLINKEGG